MTHLRSLLLDTRDGEWGKGEAAPGRTKMRVIRGTDFAAVREAVVEGVPWRFLEDRHANRKRLQEWDIVFETAGGSHDRPTGRSLLLTPRIMEVLGAEVTCASFARFLRVNLAKADPAFVFWLLQHLYATRAIAQFNTQHTGVARFQFTTFCDTFDLDLPSLDEQRRIAAILGAYDDLIEVNRRRVALLEGMARSLFEEWFVRFRFPGHEAVPMIDTPDGPVPKGWAWSNANQVLDFDPKTRVPREGEKPFVSMGHLDTSTSVIAPHEWREGNSGAKFQTGDVLFARITPCLENGKAGLVRDLPGGVGFGSTEFIVMRGARAGSAFAYCLARSEPFRAHAISGMSGASGRQRARTDSVSAFTIATPPGSNLFDRFEAAVAPMLEAVGQYAKANAALAASRDLLLPRLISGQLSVAAAERELEVA